MAISKKYIFFNILLLINIHYVYLKNSPNSENNDNNSDIDTIQSIEALTNQIIINTSKFGPIDVLKINVDVYDLENKKLLFSNSYSGILLLISRGKYVINFLEPFHWYGIVYQVFQTTPHESKHHIEKVMVKTINEKTVLSSQKGAPLNLNIKSERSKLEETHLVVFSMKWNESTKDRNAIDYAKANITLECNKGFKSKEITLSKSELGKNIEIKIENDFGIHEENNGSHKLIAVVKPKYCHKLCWNGKLYSKVLEHTFERDILYECEEFNPIYTQTEVRDYVSYKIDDGKLIIFTTQPNVIPTTDEKDDIIKIKAVQLAHLDINDENTTEINLNDEKNQKEKELVDNDDNDDRNSTIEKEFIITGKDRHNLSQFEIKDLEENSYYAVSYDYKKLNPIPYRDEQYFVIQMPGENATKPTFLPVTVNISTTPDEKGGSSGDLEENENFKPKINFYISKEFIDHRILIEIQPIINETNFFLPITSTTNDSVFWLTQQSYLHSFDIPEDVIKYFCTVCKLNIIVCNTYGKEENDERVKRNVENNIIKNYDVQRTPEYYQSNESVNNMLTTESKLMDTSNDIGSNPLKNNVTLGLTSLLSTTTISSTTFIENDEDVEENNGTYNDKDKWSSRMNLSNLSMQTNMSSALKNVTFEKCSHLQICYKLHIYLNSKMYDMGKDCHNLTKLLLVNGKNNLYPGNLMFLFYTFYVIYYHFVKGEN